MPLPAGLGVDDGVQFELADHSQHGLDLAVGQVLLDREGFGGGDERFPGQAPADDVDEGIGEVGDIAKGFMFDLTDDAEGAAAEIGALDLALVVSPCGGHMDATGSEWDASIVWDTRNVANRQCSTSVATNGGPEPPHPL